MQLFPPIRTVSLKAGGSVELSPGVTLIVGANNVGKSQFLREIDTIVRNPPQTKIGTLIVDGVQATEPTVSEEQFLSWIHETFPDVSNELQEEPQYRSFNQNTTAQQSAFSAAFRKSDFGHMLSDFWFRHVDVQSRLTVPFSSTPYNRISGAIENPLQKLFASPETEHALSRRVDAILGETITVNRHIGAEIALQMGTVTGVDPVGLPVSEEYWKALLELPRVDNQGDGIKSIVGLLLILYTMPLRTVLIDEPETFLHPPQARKLGRLIALEAKNGVQVVAATHSEAFVEGVLDGSRTASAEVGICRITRDRTSSTVIQVPTKDVRNIYSDPLMRYSRLTGGLFGSGTVVCEGDSDCTYLQALTDYLFADEDGEKGELARASDVHYVHCGGKARIPRAVELLRAAGVPAASVVDIDILQNETEFETLVAAHGGDSSIVLGDRAAVANGVEQPSSRVRRSDARTEITDILTQSTDTFLSTAEIKKIKTSVTKPQAWTSLKLGGRTALVGSADAINAFDRIIRYCTSIGLFICPVGELERWHPTIPSGDKAEWLKTVVEARRFQEDEAGSHDFIRSLARFVTSAGSERTFD